MKNIIKFCLLLGLFLPCIVLFSSCKNESGLKGIAASFFDSPPINDFASFSFEYGEEIDVLENIKLYGLYTDKGIKEIYDYDITIFDQNGELLQMFPKVPNCGKYNVFISYQNNCIQIEIVVNKSVLKEDVNIKLFTENEYCNNTYEYGSEKYVDVIVEMNGCDVDKNLYSSKIYYITKDVYLGLEQKQPDSNIMQKSLAFDKSCNLNVGEYYLFVKFDETDNYSSSFSNFSKITIKPASIFVQNKPVAGFSYNDLSNYKLGDIELSDLIIYDAGTIVTSVGTEIESLHGEWRFIEEKEKINSSNDKDSFKIQWVSNNKNYDNSEIVEIEVNIQKGYIYAPFLQNGLAWENGIEYDGTLMKLDLLEDSLSTKYYQRSGDELLQLLPGNFNICYKLLDNTNYQWVDAKGELLTNGEWCYIGEVVDDIINFSWEIQKCNLPDLQIVANSSLTNEKILNIEFKFLNSNANFNFVDMSWEICVLENGFVANEIEGDSYGYITDTDIPNIKSLKITRLGENGYFVFSVRTIGNEIFSGKEFLGYIQIDRIEQNSDFVDDIYPYVYSGTELRNVVEFPSVDSNEGRWVWVDELGQELPENYCFDNTQQYLTLFIVFKPNDGSIYSEKRIEINFFIVDASGVGSGEYEL